MAPEDKMTLRCHDCRGQASAGKRDLGWWARRSPEKETALVGDSRPLGAKRVSQSVGNLFDLT